MGETATGTAAETAPDTDDQRDNRRWWTVVIFGYATLEGVALQVRGAVIPNLALTFGAPEWQLGLIAPAGTVGFLVVVTVVGAVVGRLDTRRVLLFGVVGTGVGALAMGLAPTFPLFLAAVVGRGVLRGAGRGTDRPLLSHLYPTQRGRFFSYYDMMWAAGATAGPLLAAAAIAVADWRWAYFALAAAFVPLVVLITRLDTPTVGGDDPLDLAELRRIGRRPEVGAMAVALFLSVGVEGGLFTWLTTYAGTQLPDTLATVSLSVMLAGYVPGRLLSGSVAERVGYVRLSVALAALTVPAIWYTFFVADGVALLAGAFAIGLTLSGLYPTLLAYGTEAVPEHSAPVNATASVTASAGIAVVPAAMGFAISGAGVARAMTLLVGLAALLLAVLVTTALLVGTVRDRPDSNSH
ncbi:MFS transporter [Haloarcula litorea]|uniref:MFS transporter n=1 Tax=Haloarcula litorea TaxID=3032579 RepID=UPI0023E8F3DF|nr:MFS transporter [Halomicroarcula sp. GDY20]